MVAGRQVDVAIVGGGISGLSAAFDLQQRGLAVCVLEASDRLGGVIRTDRINGWVIDGGPDSLLVQKPAAVNLCRELGIADRLISTLRPRAAYVLRDGRLHAIAEGSFLGFPLSAGSLARSSLFTIGGRLRMAAEIAVPRADGHDDESIASFVRRRFGSEAVDYLADPLLAGIHAGDAERLSVLALFPRLVAAERETGSVIRAFRALHVTPSPQGAFVSLPGGVGELIDALTAALAPETVIMSAPVEEVRRTDTFIVETGAGAVHARAVILAAPAYVAGRLLRPFDTSLGAMCEAIPYASTATVALGYTADQIGAPMSGSGFVVPRVERSPLLAATWVTSKWPGRAPEDHVLMRAFLGGGRDPSRLDEHDDSLIATAAAAMAETMKISGAPLFARLFRWARQSPQHEVGHLARIASIESRLAEIPGVFLTGSGFRAVGIPDCIADARKTAASAARFVAGGR